MNDGQFEERLKRLETLMERVVAKVLGEEMPRLPEAYVETPHVPYDPTKGM
jgi:hypothetical protein